MSKKIRLTVRIPKELNSSLTEKAEEIGISKNSLILQILWKKVEEVSVNEWWKSRKGMG